MTNDFDDIIEAYDTATYITVSTKELYLKLIPFFQLPARKIAHLYSLKNNQQKFIKEIYKILHISMENPAEFKAKVYDTAISYTGLLEFLNTWINISSMINKFEAGEIDSDGNPVNKTVVSNVDIMQNIIFQRLADGKDVKTKMLIRYLSENIRQLAVQYNETVLDVNDLITEVNIRIPISEELKDEF